MGKISQGACAVVTGAGSGIGRAFALEIAGRNGKVLCADINLTSALETVEQIRQNGRQAWAVACDVSKLEQVEALVILAERHFGGPANLVVNNAGIGVGGRPIGALSLEDWQITMNVNLWGVIHGCQVFASRFRTLGRGGIVNVASAASFAAAPLMGPYNVTKAGVLSLTETLAAEMAGTNIHVTALCPSFVKTNIVANGRIPAATANTATRLMERTGVSPESVVRKALDGLDCGHLYVVPQFDARAIWWVKRMAPTLYTRVVGRLGRRLPRA